MHLTFEKYPITLIICLLWSIFTLVFILLDINNIFRIILSIPIIIFIPGYLLIYALFPEKTEKRSIDNIQRIALSIGISIAIVPFFGIVLNYSPWKISLIPIILTLETFILILGGIALKRWHDTPPSNRYILTINLSLPKDETKIDRLLTIFLLLCIIITISLVIYAVFVPKQGEQFTVFYVLGPNHLAYDYPLNLSIGENATVILGIVNHEHSIMNYSLEVWLSNQTIKYNNITKMNETIYHNLWFLDHITCTLPHQPLNLVDTATSQWEYNYTFNITKKGFYKVVFLLYTTDIYRYSKNQDYRFMAYEKVDNDQINAYRNLYLWINVQ